MVLTPQSSRVCILLENLPVAAAGLNADGTILEVNSRFRQLLEIEGTAEPWLKLEDLVRDRQRPEVRRGLADLRGSEQEHRASVRLDVSRSSAPHAPLAIDISRLAPDEVFSYLVCVQPVAPSHSIQSWHPMLTTLSHELRGPLSAIRGWVSMAEKGTLSADMIPRVFGIIGRNADSLSSLVENLFDISRNVAGFQTLHLELVNLEQLVELVAESVSPVASGRGVRLTVAKSRGPLWVNGDRVRLEQVVRNLVDNAIKFTPAGGRVSVRTRSRQPFGELSVQDTGAGIHVDLLSVIFDPFRRGILEGTRGDVGMGLGLALVRELVHLHHGEVGVSSRGQGRGSTFMVKLPLAPPPVTGSGV